MEALTALAVFIVGAVVTGIVGDKAVKSWSRGESGVGAWRRRAALAAQKRRTDQRRITDAVVRRYETAGTVDALYSLQTVPGGQQLPMLHDTQARSALRMDASTDAPFQLTGGATTVFPFDRRTIRRARRAGIDMRDGSTLFTKGFRAAEGLPTIDVGTCNYFATASTAQRVREALLEGTGEARGFRELVDLYTGPSGPLTIGGDAACLFGPIDDPVVALHKRSSTVINAHGLYAVTPAFGFESNVADGQRSRFGLVHYNVFREYLEEFWQIDDLHNTGSKSKTATPDWIFRNPPGQALLEELDADRVSVYLTGLAVDLTHLTLLFSLVVHFESPEFLAFSMEAPGSHEADDSTPDRPPVFFRKLFGDEVTALMSLGDMKMSSLYALDRARLMCERQSQVHEQ